ncbi:serine/threonine-protein kinase [Paenibacillus paridis]|uniref:serine/threonine-protein kinase n=1 Tax=Paenibacillus paridis TaxID=2583376 RepID=UPI0011230611|nr:serine/threonine-protein kinase [Paenibacillus paridis]
MSSNTRFMEKIAETQISIISKYFDKIRERYFVIKEVKNLDHYAKIFFEREVSALRRLNHKNIVKMDEYEITPPLEGKVSGKIYLEHIPGEELLTINRSLIEPSDKVKIIIQLVDAVEAAHSQSIIHRDIKPSNIMIIDYKQLKLIDFGLSKIKGMITGDTIYKYGSNSYSAPEVGYHPENASYQSDIYSVGATIYFLLTGKEPDLPEYLMGSIEQNSDVTPRLKRLLLKAVEPDLKKRYETITDFKRDLNMIMVELLSESSFAIGFPLELLSKAKRQKYVPANINIHQFICNYLDKWFGQEVYGFIDSKLETATLQNGETVSFYCPHGYLLECIYKDEDERFIISALKYIQPKYRNATQKKYLRINGKPVFFHSMGYQQKEQFKTYEIVNELVDHRMDYQSDESKQTEFERFFGLWSDYLDKEKELIISAAESVEYTDFNYSHSDKTMEFELMDSNVEDLGFTNETTIVYDPDFMEPERGKRSKPVVIGKFKEVVFYDEKIYLIVKVTNRVQNLPQKGILVEDYRIKFGLIDKQKRAIRALSNDEALCNENLKDIILGFETPKSLDSFNSIEFFNQRIDSNQKEAVKVALNTSSIALIQGPPGTGKTTVIREVVNQILSRNALNISQEKYKTLIVSQSHTAVDNVIEGLHFPQNLNTKIIRIGADENILPAIRDQYSVNNARNVWERETKEASTQKMRQLAEHYGIDLFELVKYVDLKSKLQKTDEELLIVQQIEAMYNSDLEKARILRTAMIQNDWITRLGLAKDSEARLIENATIVAGTCTGFNSNPSTKNMRFDYVIVDEGAKASVPELLIPLLKGSRLILVGDHKQLPPVLNIEAIKRSTLGKREDFEKGMFKHLYDNFPDTNRIRLTTQYRMHRIIGNMISKVFYGNEIQTGIDDSERLHSLNLFKEKQLIWVSTSKLYNRRETYNSKNKAFKNHKEIQIIKKMLLDLDREECTQGYEIAVITGYNLQKTIIKDFVNRTGFKNIRNIEVNTVDSYQGKDKDIVIYSTVRSNTFRDIGFQKSENRINVALSRARKLLVIVGDKDHFMNNTEPTNRLPDIIRYISQAAGCEIIDYKEQAHARK